MGDYISRDMAIARLTKVEVTNRLATMTDAKREIAEMPAADVAPVVHGWWVTPHWHNSDYCYNCSKCGGEAMHREYQWARNGIYPICPNCGAKMMGETHESERQL